MLLNSYNFVTVWNVQGTIEEVANVLMDPSDLVRWWPTVYLNVTQTAGGGVDGIGTQFELKTKGWLPYTLFWKMRVTGLEPPFRITIDATGDFVGHGRWTLQQVGRIAKIQYEWRVLATKPLLKYGSVVGRPFFEANHRWAMRSGEECLRAELSRRRAVSTLCV